MDLDLGAVRRLHVFDEFSDEQFAAFVSDGEPVRVDAGEVIIAEGQDPAGVFVLVEGQVDVSKRLFGREALIRRYGPGCLLGESGVLTRSPYVVTARATTPTLLIRWAPDVFYDLLEDAPCLNAMLKTMSARLRDIEALARQQEKLTALGRLAAGLAHELNNPASASLRSARQLLDILRSLQARLFTAPLLRLDPDRLQYLADLQDALLQRAAEGVQMDPLEQSDREEAVAMWLEEHDIEDPWLLAPRLLRVGMEAEGLEELAARLGPDAVGEALLWIGGLLEVVEHVQVVLLSTEQIEELVGAVRLYAYMDQTPQREIDVHEGLDATLAMLRHKLRNVNVIRDYAPDLPRVMAFGGELNQVWTNLIDNAADAMSEAGTVRIRTYREGEQVVVEVTDDGPGISEEAQAHLFEPFFTTKPVGKGTGLGLDIVHRIVVDKHQGDIRVSSQPGETSFQVRLPLRREGIEERAAEGGTS